MLDRIQNNTSESIVQSSSLERIQGLGISNPYEEMKNFFIDQSDISPMALEKYQREVDIKTFSDILMQTDEQEATNLVLQRAFDGNLSVDNDEFLFELLNNEEFLNDVIS